ncbi:MAG: hypothetical protein ACLFM5_01925 [Spirochaetaceae bacterium]
MGWIEEELAHIHGVEELRKVAEGFLRADRETQQSVIEQLWRFVAGLEGEEKTKFTVMAVILQTAADVMRERLGE